MLDGRQTNQNTGAGIGGMRLTLSNTGAVTSTESNGNWSFTVAGPGTYSVGSYYPQYVPVIRRYVLDSDCRRASSTIIASGPRTVDLVDLLRDFVAGIRLPTYDDVVWIFSIAWEFGGELVDLVRQLICDPYPGGLNGCQ